MSKKTSIGGQALIEGIMMKGPEKTVISVRTPDGKIDTEEIKEKHLRDRYKIFGWPVIRGVVNFIESMIQGYKALMISADKSGMTELEEQSAKEEEKKKQNLLINAVMVVGSVLGVALSVFLFMYLPALAFDAVNFILKDALTDTVRPVFEGTLKIIIFVGYVAAVSTMKDIKRVFMYHGAEHKSIFCYEKGLELNIENVKKQKRFHPRCGTSFMILMLVVGIIISIFLVKLLPPVVTEIRILWVLIKILTVPVICGLGYELIRICGKYDNLVTKVIAAPGMWVQRLTTKEPDDDMLEVAIESLKAVIPKDSEKDRW